MKLIKNQMLMLGAALLLLTSCEQKASEQTALNEKKDAVATSYLEQNVFTGADVLAFGPDNVLFVGDSKGGLVYAIATAGTELKDPMPYNMEGLDLLLAKQLGIDTRDLIVNDMKVHPLSQEVYLAIQVGLAPDAPAMVAIASPLNQEIVFLEHNASNSQQAALENPASDEVMFWNETPASALTITDIDYHDGYIYVAGLTNGEFASNLRKIAYPFSGDQEAVNSVEIYHAVHTQMETRAPIRTMLFDEVNGESTLIASYTCTPLVTIPATEIQAGNDVKGKTIAELGYGNTPIDILTVTTQAQDGSFNKSLLVTNKNRGASLISFAALAAGEQMDIEAPAASAPVGLDDMISIPTASVMQIDNQNQMMLAVLRRNIDTGSIDLVSELTGVYLRLSDFISEYDFPDYRYDEKQAATQGFHDMVKPMEGYPELTSENEGK